MKKALIISGIILVLGAGGYLLYRKYNKKKITEPTGNNNLPAEQQSGPVTTNVPTTQPVNQNTGIVPAVSNPVNNFPETISPVNTLPETPQPYSEPVTTVPAFDSGGILGLTPADLKILTVNNYCSLSNGTPLIGLTGSNSKAYYAYQFWNSKGRPGSLSDYHNKLKTYMGC